MNSNKEDSMIKDFLSAQREIKAAIKDSTNPHFRSSYADLPAVFDACKEALNKNAIAISQSTDVRMFGEQLVTVLITQLLHTSGAKLESVYPLFPAKDDPQGYGSAMTYARRYCLASLVGVVADVDDDAEAACGRGPQPSKPLAPPPAPTVQAGTTGVGSTVRKPVWKKGE